MPKISLAELAPDVRAKVLAAAGRKRAPRQPNGFTKDRARSWAITVLSTVSSLTPPQRARVLSLAAAMNRV